MVQNGYINAARFDRKEIARQYFDLFRELYLSNNQ
jgi:hypothetical protein